jgi:hypothetical protein
MMIPEALDPRALLAISDTRGLVLSQETARKTIRPSIFEMRMTWAPISHTD